MTASPVVAPPPAFPTDPRMAVFQNSAPSHPNPRLAGVEAASPRPDAGPAATAAVPRHIDDATRCELHKRLIGSLDLSTVGTRSEAELRAEIRLAAEELCRQSSHLLSAADRELLVSEVMDETFGLGPLEQLLRDPSISDILINGPKIIFCERRGRLEKSDVTFASDDHLLQIIQRIVSRVGRRVDATSPMVDARLADGSRVNAIIELKIFVVAVLVQRQVGGNLSEILQGLSHVVRERFRIMGLINTLTAEGRLQALILMALPPFLLIIMIFLNRDYTQSLLDHPELLIGMGVSMGLGWLWIRKIVNFDF